MRKDILLRVADIIETKPEGFDLRWWTREQAEENGCGSVCCIAGHIAEELFKEGIDAFVNNWQERTTVDVGKIVCELDLDHTQALELFYSGLAAGEDNVPANNLQCAKIIRHYVETGKVDWSILNEKK